MEKRWLIRTKSNHILGPVSKEKVIELYHNGSIRSDDEICSGNGFWFFIREKDMVSQYLLEAPEASRSQVAQHTHDKSAPHRLELVEEEMVPVQEEQESDDITLVGGINLEQLHKSPHTTTMRPTSTTVVHLELDRSKVKTNPTLQKRIMRNDPNKKAPPPPIKSQGYLKILAILGLILLICLVYFRKSLLQSVKLPELIPQAFAQEASAEVKKKF